MEEAAGTYVPPPAISTRASFKKPAAPNEPRDAAAPSADAKWSRVQKRPSLKSRPAQSLNDEARAEPKTLKRPASSEKAAKRGAQAPQATSDEIAQAAAEEKLVQDTATIAPPAGQQNAEAQTNPLEHRPVLLLMDDGNVHELQG